MMIISGVHEFTRHKSHSTVTISFHQRRTGFGLGPTKRRFRGILGSMDKLLLL